jgi:hypothetical protein
MSPLSKNNFILASRQADFSRPAGTSLSSNHSPSAVVATILNGLFEQKIAAAAKEIVAKQVESQRSLNAECQFLIKPFS